LKSEVTDWACYSNYLVYRTPQGNDIDDYISIIDLENPTTNKVFVKDFSIGKDDNGENPFTYMFFAKGQLWLGNKTKILVG
jgi:hypothetical protein